MSQSLGNIKHISFASKVVEIQAGQNSYGFLSSLEICNLLGIATSAFDATKLGACVLNADGAAFPTHLESPTYTNATLYIVFKDKLTIKMNCRINFVLFYIG